MEWAIYISVASLASILALALQLYKNKEKPKTYMLLVIALLLSVISAGLWVDARNLTGEKKALEEENKKILSARYKAQSLVEKWPKPEKFDFTSSGEFRGIVLSGMAFLEIHRDLFPETYQTAKVLFLDELGVGANDDEKWYSQRSNLQEAAESIVLMMKSIQIEK